MVTRHVALRHSLRRRGRLPLIEKTAKAAKSH